MNIRVTYFLFGSVMICLAGCQSLPQSALIYSSRSVVGLSLASNPASASGVTISVGVDILDAAYVPVAVAGNSKDGCNNPNCILPIVATYGNNDGADQKTLTDANQTKLDTYLTALTKYQNIQATINNLSNKKVQTTILEATLKRTQDDLATASKLNPPDQQKLSDATEAIERAQETLSNTQADNKKIDDQIANYNADLAAAKVDADDKRAAALQVANLLATEKKDAYSVFGRFNSSTSGGSSTANGSSDTKQQIPSASVSLTAGKIFSTGVASQNLTEAARISAISESFTSCIKSVSDFSQTLEKKDDTTSKKLTDQCMAMTKSK